jgi:uncharacterized phage protein gp47/JayE
MAIADLVYIDATGYHFPDYPTVLSSLQDEYRSIFGSDIYLEPDSQDGQFVAVLAQAIYDTMSIGASVYNAFSPSSAQGTGLSRNVKINGIARRIATYSTADLTIVGQVGTTILNGQAEDTIGQKWNLPASVVIPLDGDIIVTATAEDIGAIRAGAGAINKIATPTLGWQTVTNVLAAVEGAPIETDFELRQRQTISVALPSKSVIEGTVGAVASVDGVTRYKGYENDSNITDVDGIPAHNIAIIAEGGDVADIATAIAIHKTPGTPTYGTTSYDVIDQYGLPNTINFFRPTNVGIKVEVTIEALAGYISSTGDAIKQAVADYINSLDIGADVYLTRLYVPANLSNVTVGNTFEVTLIRAARLADPLATSNIVLTFIEAAECSISDITLIVT